ncbi:histidine phosphatase family protein [uncultured Shewanella sp.]|uniref:histidine phosphatase family protein n=1 Tax=Shewanella atlantica TaxID=271099 RepID=UPI00260D16E7|nr:histidine phosphatase family protein [uncultured Shewanella sp.]
MTCSEANNQADDDHKAAHLANSEEPEQISPNPGITTTFYLMRHGECEGGDILRGHTDVSLSHSGREQMFDAIEAADISFEHIISSPLRRCCEFALRLYLKRGVPLKLEDGLKEMNFGDWDGETLESLYQNCAGPIEAYWKNPWASTPPDGERMLDFEARIAKAWESMLNQHRGQSLLLITHAGVIRHLMARALGVSGVAGFYTQLSLAYGSIVKITVYTTPQGVHYPRLHWG